MTNNKTEQTKGIQIEARDICLRYAQESDLKEYFTFLQDPEMNWLTGSQSEVTYEETASWIKKISVMDSDRVDFMIILKRTNELLGEVVLNEIDANNRSANIRIGIQKNQHRGKGYGTEAMIEMLRYGFNTLNLHRIHLGVFTFNPRAIHVYEKIGFKREGVERDSLFLDGEFHNMITMSILEDEFRSLHESPNLSSRGV